jgi:diketogulonate reductase-like aldo/keto reductase
VLSGIVTLMSDINSQSKAKLSDGNEIPLLGFGTYEMDDEEAYRCVTWALEAGYRHIVCPVESGS